MPKAILEFNLPEEQDEFRMAIDGIKWHLAVWDLNEIIRKKLKYEELTDVEFEAWDKCQQKLFGVLEDRNLSLDDVS